MKLGENGDGGHAAKEDAATITRPASARIGQPITGLKIAYARDWFADDPQASPALIRKEGCDTCTDCGYSKCG